MLKRLLNVPERITYQRLAELCSRRQAQVFSKVRLADVLPIEGSGLPSDHFAFALQAHFDFVVSDLDHRPLFAVEFDGPTHTAPDQAARDAIKDRLSRRFGLPLLRIRAGDLHRSEARLDRLTDIADRWFARATARGSAAGPAIPSSPPGGDRGRGEACPTCGAGMVVKPGKYGPFLSCVRYPECRGSCDLPSLAATSPRPIASHPSPPVRQDASAPVPPPRLIVSEPLPVAPVRISPGLIAASIFAVVVVAAITAFVTTYDGRRPPISQPAPPIAIVDPIPLQSSPLAPEVRAIVRQASATSFEPATDRQMNFLGALVKRRGWNAARLDNEARQVLGYDRSQAELSKTEASRLISAWDDRKK